MTTLPFLLLVLCVTVHGVEGGTRDHRDHSHGHNEVRYRYNTPLDPAAILWLYWDVDYVTSTVFFHLRAKTKNWDGWFGMGFSEYGDISDADLAVFWTDEHGWQLDGWTDHDGCFHNDRQQDYHLIESNFTDDVATVSFSRKFDTCDNDDYRFDNGTTHVVYFLGRNNCLAGEEHGLMRVQLLKPNLPEVILPDDAWYFDVTVPQVHVPSSDTTYWWYVKKLPPFRTKQHVIKYGPLVQPGHEGLVHHMELFHCDIDVNASVPLHNGPGPGKFEFTMPAELLPCQQVMGAWANGGETMVYPEEAGMPIGGENFSSYFVIEVHYNNPKRKAGIVDSSGLRFHVTSKLRAHDAGIMQLGLTYTDKMAIPPRQESFSWTGYCSHQCTELGLPPTGITIFGSHFHTHMTGKAIRTRHVRRGVELPEIDRDDHYSTYFQLSRRLQFPMVMEPGDSLITSCDFNTMDRKNVTVGGMAMRQEMCVHYIYYYPRTNLEVCKSAVDTAALQNFFSSMRNQTGNQTTSPENSPSQNYAAIKWTKSNVGLLDNFYQTAPLALKCEQSDSTRLDVHFDETSKSRILHPLKHPGRHCPKLEEKEQREKEQIDTQKNVVEN